MKATLENIQSQKAPIGVIGLGYVGLPLALAFAKKGFTVSGFDVDPNKVACLQIGQSYIGDVASAEIAPLIQSKKFSATTSFDRLHEMDAIIICVPTPLRKSREPDLSFVLAAGLEIQKRLRKGQLIVLESTTYPGTTEELILPLLEKRNLKVGQDFCLAFSPERIDPGNKVYQIHNTPKIVGGVTTNCLELAAALYHQVVEQVIPVSSPRVAELVKLLENTFRAVNIALVNEMAIICHKLGVETGEVIRAAASKPFGFMPFMPGPGLGGHCIPVDPQYLSWKLKTLKYHPRFIQLADEINMAMPAYVVSRVASALNGRGKSIKGADILVMGVSYKKDVGDIRESPALEVIEELIKMGADVSYHDPFVSEIQINDHKLFSTTPAFAKRDCVVILTDHSGFDYEKMVLESSLLFDARNATYPLNAPKEKIVRL